MRNSRACRVLGIIIVAVVVSGGFALRQRSPQAARSVSEAPEALQSPVAALPKAAPATVPASTPPVATAVSSKTEARSAAALPSEPQFAAFQEWLNRFQAADAQGQAALEAEGLFLAEQRRAAMFSLIQTDPARALELAVPVGSRESMPAGIRQLLEEPVHARGDYSVLGVYPLPGQEKEVIPVQRFVNVGDRQWRAFVYGDRVDYPTKRNISLHGIALDDVMAVSKDAVVVRSASEPGLAPPLQEAICSVSGTAVTVVNDPTPVDVGGEITWLCRYDHAEELNGRLLAAAGQPSSGGEGEPAESNYTEGRKRVIMFRVAFSDLSTPDVSSNSLVSTHAGVNSFWRTNSYGRTSLAPLGQGSTIVQINLSSPYASYDDDAGALRDDVRAAATAQGIDLSTYDFDITYTGSGRPSFSFGGLGYVGGPGSWVVGSSTSITAHELGHNLGFPHANYWDTGGQSAIGPGGNQEYGDPYDVMGGGSASGGATGHYVSKFKWRIGWLLDEDFPRVTTSGTYRIYAHDQMDGRGVRGLRFPKDGTLDYFLEFRQLLVGNLSQMNGLGLRWGSPGGSSSQLIDTTPNSPGGKNDAAITIGRTFSDASSGVHITPVGFGGTYPQSMDVRINFGNPATNQAPSLTMAANPEATGVNAPVILTALATDPNGDTLAYSWDFGDGTFSTNNAASVVKTWGSTGDYVVRCVVSDMKGRTASKSILVRVGSPTTFTISGHVLSGGRGLADVQVRASSSRVSYTDSDGRYIIAGLTASNYNVAAQLYPLSFQNPFFANPVAVGPSQENIDFIGVIAPLNDVTLSPTGAVWKYLATGANLGTGWVAPAYNDSSWSSGRGEFGYGDGDEATVVSYGPDANNKYITTYFRRAFTVPDPSLVDNFTVSLRRDDGGIVYVNGNEVLRDNLPSGVVSYNTTAVDNSEDTTVAVFDRGVIVPGTNYLAVEIHQVTPSSSDMSFDLSLTATTQTNYSRLDAFYIARPVGGDVFRVPATVVIEAGAYSTDDTYNRVEFFRNGDSLGEDVTAPFSLEALAVPPGMHQLLAVATLASGRQLTSGPVQITVESPIEQVAVVSNAQWRYHDGGIDLGTAWRSPAYSDSAWSSGAAPLGFGDPGIATVIENGPSGNRTPTFYFRQRFNLVDAGQVTNLWANLYRDDGAVIYLNGQEAVRVNMPAGTISYATLASAAVDGVNETTPVLISLPSGLLQDGTNLVAVELHQSGLTSSDARFDLELGMALKALPQPGVRLTSPLAGTTVIAPTTIPLAATAVPNAGETVERVAFTVNGVPVQEDTTVPYQFDWSAVQPGSAVLRALAYEVGGNIHTSAPVNILVKAPAVGLELISPRALWRYLDTGVDAGVAWRQRTFNDSDWAQGYARLGYGNDGELSVVSFGGDPAKRYITTYFRRPFTITNLSAVHGLLLQLSRDDGAVVYLNGNEVYRNNLLGGVVVSHNSLALTSIEGSEEGSFLQTRLAPTGLITGTNVIAVEIHQQALNSSDLGFDLSLIAETDTNLTEGVYLTSPAKGARITMPAAVILSAFAVSDDETISGVEFFGDGISLGQDNTAPFDFSWAGGSAGEHTVLAVAHLSGGGSLTSAPVSVTIETPPIMIAPVMNTFIASGTAWRYLNSATAPASDWNTRGFNDSAWSSGNARFGYGLDGEVTLLPGGRVTHYFRRWFSVANPALLENLIFQLQRDDGAVVYLNGVEMFRSNMPEGPIGNSTVALATANGLDEQQFFITMLPALGLVAGTNLLAVELHQSAANSSDAGFDLHLSGAGSTAPRILLSRPTTGQQFTPDTAVEMEASAWPGQSRTITKVEFFGNNAKIGEATAAPYVFAWSGLPFGTHTVRARMTDNFGTTLDSDTATITVGYMTVATNFISAGANWKYLDTGANLGTAWAQTFYNDLTWASGPGELGYGDGDEATTVGYGPSSSAKFITTYFRRSFVVPPDWVITNLNFRLIRDDGAVVWLNGREAYRSNMPAGGIAFNTLAAGTVDNANESTFFPTSLSITNLPVGTNVVAVEVHQRAANSSDISFELELTGVGYSVAAPAPRPQVGLLANGQVRVSWKTTAGWSLVTSMDLGPGAVWSPVGTPPVDSGGTSSVTLNAAGFGAFYRLAK